jgi:hypothetical protein
LCVSERAASRRTVDTVDVPIVVRRWSGDKRNVNLKLTGLDCTCSAAVGLQNGDIMQLARTDGFRHRARGVGRVDALDYAALDIVNKRSVHRKE